MTRTDLARLFDHTLLRPEANEAAIESLCREAKEFGFATVCVNPFWVPFAAQRLAGSAVGVGTVVGFPLGAAPADIKAYEALRAIVDGATEIDMVMNIGAMKSGDLVSLRRDIEAVVHTCRDRGVLSKVILEATLLSDAEKVSACRLVKEAGADFVKTSTGFGPGGATPSDVALMRQTVGMTMGVKAAGGVQSLEAVQTMLAAGANRIGSSASVRIMQEIRDQ